MKSLAEIEKMWDALQLEHDEGLSETQILAFWIQIIKDLARESLEAVPETQNDVCTCEYHGCFRSCDCWNREDGRMEARSSLEAYWASVLK